MKLLAPVLFLALGSFQAQDPLPSWNDTAPKNAIVEFVQRVTKEGSPDFVPAKERIAAFDNDGTLDEANARGWTMVSEMSSREGESNCRSKQR